MKKLLLLLFLVPNLTSGDPGWTKVEPGKSVWTEVEPGKSIWKAIDTVKKSGLSCFTETKEISVSSYFKVEALPHTPFLAKLSFETSRIPSSLSFTSSPAPPTNTPSLINCRIKYSFLLSK